MTDQPILSICIPTYNRAEYLDKTLQSIVKEKIFLETNLVEIVVSNNCSTDNTDAICKKFQKRYQGKIKYISQEIPIRPDNHIFKTIKYASGQFCKLNNDTCKFKENTLEKIVNLLANNTEDAMFFLNKPDIEAKVIKCSSFDEFIKNASYEATWIGGFCIKKDIFCKLTLPSMYLDLKLPQIWVYGALFTNNYSVCIIQDDLFEVQYIPNKGGNYNIAKVFGQNYFKILSDFLKENNGISLEILNEEKKNILPFIENFYFDFNNEFTFQKTGYLKYMLPLYYNKLYFWKSYLKAVIKIYLVKNILKNIFFVNTLYLDDKKYKVITFLGIKIKKKVKFSKKDLFNISSAKNINFLKCFYDNNYNLKKDFVPFTNEPYKRNLNDVKLLAFYLPQYHRIPLNDKFHGEGFTDWKNVTASVPQFTGHYQPHLPADCGFYDLSNPKVLEEQVKKAQTYGIYGFCYHYYWFSGDRLLEKPIFDMLNNKNITMPYCLCWANENWSTLWDGGNKEVIKNQELKDEDDEKFFNDILPFFKDERYIKVDNKPLLVIYRPSLFEKDRFCKFINTIRNLAKENGFDDLYILSSNFQFDEDQNDWNLNGVLEFPPHGMEKNGLQLKNVSEKFVNSNFVGEIWDMKDYIENKKYLYNSSYNLFKGVFPSWDNSARKAYSNASVFEGLTPELYKNWLIGCIDYTNKTKSNSENFVFINAWNEWAEGAHLEADLKYGYAYLQATKDVLEEYND